MPNGDCEGADGLRYWVVRNKKGGHEQTPSSPPSSQIKGEVFCHHDPSRSWIEWTGDRLNMYSVAIGRDPPRLYEWWASRGGPIA
jgi:hypothetical protein